MKVKDILIQSHDDSSQDAGYYCEKPDNFAEETWLGKVSEPMQGSLLKIKDAW